MGQKVNPIGYRLGNTFSWRSKWYADSRHYQDVVLEDYNIREFLKKTLANAGLVRADIERSIAALKVIVLVSRPGVVIGKGGDHLRTVATALEEIVNKGKRKQDRVKVDLKVEEETKPDLSAKLVAERIVDQLIKRYPHRRAVNQALEKVMQAGAEGVKISLSGRIGGAEIGRTEKYAEGKVPTQTLRANIDYYQVPARTRSGYVGIKVWIYKGMLVA
jgi:small subunit ribosomal protein S3